MTRISSYTLKVILAASFGSITYGYASGIAAAIVAQPNFLKYFDYGRSTDIADAFNGLFSGSGIIGVLFGGFVSEKFGRKPAIFTGCGIAMLGGILMTASVALSMLYVARIVMGISVGMLVMLIPLYQTEVAPAEGRGLLVSMHGVMILLGYSLAGWINIGLYFASIKSNWRVAFAFQILWPLCLAISMCFLPESPRWLVEHDLIGKARSVFTVLEPLLTDDEFELLVSQISNESKSASWKSVITMKSYRKRLLIGLLVMIGGQGTGTVAITNYGPTIYGNLGFDNLQQLYIGTGQITSGILWNFISGILADVLGRKALMMIGFLGAGVLSMTLETIMCALYAGTNNKGGNSAAVFFMYLHILFYGGTTDATTYVYVNEIWPTHIRSKGSALCTTGLFIGILAFTTGVTTAMQNIGWKFYLVFICMSFVNFFLLWVFVPETKNLTLEEIGELFGDVNADSIDHKSVESHAYKENEKLKGIVRVNSFENSQTSV